MDEAPYTPLVSDRQCVKCDRWLKRSKWSQVEYGLYEAKCDCGCNMLLWIYEDGKAIAG